MVQLSHPYMITGKTIDRPLLAMSLLFNILSRLAIAFLLRSKLLLISWLQSPSAVILEPRKIKFDIVCTVSPPIYHDIHRQHIKKQRYYFVNKGLSSQVYGFFQ